MNVIHAIGDSHASVFSGRDEMQEICASKDVLPYFRSYRIGPATAYNLAKKMDIINGIISGFPIGTKIMFCFGEVDCRAHLINQAEIQHRPLPTVIMECVDRYFSVMQHYQSFGYDMMAWNVIPSSTTTMGKDLYPSYGTCQDRNKVARIFNGYLSKLCEKHNMRFVSIFDSLVYDNDITNMSFYADHMHLSQKIMPLVLKELRDVIN